MSVRSQNLWFLFLSFGVSVPSFFGIWYRAAICSCPLPCGWKRSPLHFTTIQPRPFKGYASAPERTRPQRKIRLSSLAELQPSKWCILILFFGLWPYSHMHSGGLGMDIESLSFCIIMHLLSSHSYVPLDFSHLQWDASIPWQMFPFGCLGDQDVHSVVSNFLLVFAVKGILATWSV